MHAPLLHGLISAWLRVTNANNMTTWIAHGSLLGWYWNGISFPWDADYDVQMPIADLHKLSRQFNQTVIVDFGTSNSQEVRLGRYFLDCGTWVSHRGPGNGLNNIDARFIDMDSGLYIDITGLAVSPITAPERYESQLPAELQRPVGFNSSRADPETEFRRNMAGHLYNCRNRHFSSLQEISPLRLTLMEGVPAYIPNNFTAMLEAEYSARGINGQIFRSHTFLPRLRLWVPSKILSHYSQNIQHQAAKQVDLGDHVPGALEHVDKYWIYEFSDQDYLEMMNLEKEMLFEYLVTKDTTVIHQEEMELLLSDQSTEDFFFEDGVFKHKLGHLRRDINNYMAVKQHREFPEKLREYMDMYQSYKKGEEYVGSDQLPIPAPQALSPIRLQSPGQGLTRNRMG
ncbi:hypothetical protein JCM33374_g2877 [Metschnikowia sp. JCM 33374]|nr:hypothetical protein JCM33374_g2877 [Metschnikowia sp. JCM 33374]